jgi:hypothetical protein
LASDGGLAAASNWPAPASKSDCHKWWSEVKRKYNFLRSKEQDLKLRDHEIARVSEAWLLLQVTNDAQYDWSVDAKEAWREAGDYPAMSRYVLQLCRDVAPDDEASIGMIGASPLEDLIEAWPDAGLSLVERNVESNRVLLQALKSVWTRQPAVREGIDAILAAWGGTRG